MPILNIFYITFTVMLVATKVSFHYLEFLSNC